MSNCLSEVFCILRCSELDCSEIDTLIQWGMSTQDASVIRQCLGMMLSMVSESSQRVVALFKSALDPAVREIIMSDSLSSVSFVRLCWSLYQATNANEYLKSLCSLTQESGEACSLQAMECVCQIPYSILATLNTNGDQGDGGSFIKFYLL